MEFKSEIFFPLVQKFLHGVYSLQQLLEEMSDMTKDLSYHIRPLVLEDNRYSISYKFMIVDATKKHISKDLTVQIILSTSGLYLKEYPYDGNTKELIRFDSYNPTAFDVYIPELIESCFDKLRQNLQKLIEQKSQLEEVETKMESLEVEYKKLFDNFCEV